MRRAVCGFLLSGVGVLYVGAGQNELAERLSTSKLRLTLLALQDAGASRASVSRPLDGPFRWPNGKRVAVSLSFDDTRASQMDAGLPLFDRYHAKVTFTSTRRT
jgi:peptidoglycan/xylan/chitin deacetylase (PgdA/CDA1 family)